MTTLKKTKVAIIGSGNIGTDLMIKVMRKSKGLEMGAMVGIDPDSDGLARAKRMGIATTHEGIDGLVKLDVWPEIGIVFDATSAGAHKRHNEVVTSAGKVMIDLTPAAIGPYVIPVVNGDAHLDASNVNMVTCGGQATIPIVAAVASVATVHYAEIVASIASKSAGPGTRANIDEFTETTSKGIEEVGGARKGKAIIVLNPAEPPMIMRDTVFTLSSRLLKKPVCTLWNIDILGSVRLFFAVLASGRAFPPALRSLFRHRPSFHGLCADLSQRRWWRSCCGPRK